MIAFEAAGTGPRIALLHGFTQDRRCWPVLADDLRTDHEVVLVDLPGHGSAAPVGAPVEEAAAALADEIGPAIWVGYSMGGRHAIRLATHHREVTRGVVTIGATAGIADDAERAARRHQDDDRAIEVMLEGLEEFIDRWLDLPLFSGIPDERRCRTERLDNTVEGLASSLVLAGTGAQEPLWHLLPTATSPLVAMAGEHDEKFVELARRLTTRWGGPARVEVVPDCTHAVPLVRPEAVAAAVRSLTARPSGS